MEVLVIELAIQCVRKCESKVFLNKQSFRYSNKNGKSYI